jgi:ATP-dependent DNA ligase
MNKNKKGIDGKPWNHKFVIFDILVYNGDYLLGSTFEERVKLLDKLFGTVDENAYLYKISETIYRVKTFYENFTQLWSEITKIDMLEGFVMKKIGAKLERGLTEKNNHLNILKTRKATKNYPF